MKRYSWPLRFCSVLMALALAVFIVGQPRAKAVAVIDDVAVGAMSCEAFLASIGLPLTATGGSTAVTAGITAAAGEYAAATGAAASGEAFLGTVAAGTAVSTAGAIVLTAAAAVAVGAFAYWLYTTYLADGDSATIYDNTFIDGSVSVPLNAIYVSGDIYYPVCAVLDDGFKGGDKIVLSNGNYIALTANDSTWVACYDSSGKVISYLTQGLYQRGVFWLAYLPPSVTDMPLGIVTRNQNTNAYYVTSAVSASRCSNLGILLQTDSLSVSDVGFDSVPEFPDTQQMVIDVGASAGATLEELAQSIPDQVASNTLNVTYTIVSPDEGSEGGAPEVNPNPDVEAPEDIASYTVGLGEVFPFCIPFDIYHMVTMFAAEPEAPAATWKFTLPWSGQACEVSWSLEKWDEVAELCRSLELVLFCVGLAAATYKMIKW